MRDHSGDDNNTVINRGWTAEKPTVPGWYWFRRIDLPLHCARAAVLEVSAVKCVLGVHEDYGDGVLWHPLKEYSGEWLGPITPTDRETCRAAGRVEGLREGLVKIQERVDFYTEQEQWSQGPIRAGRGLQRNEASGCAEELARLIEQAAQGGQKGRQ